MLRITLYNKCTEQVEETEIDIRPFLFLMIFWVLLFN